MTLLGTFQASPSFPPKWCSHKNHIKHGVRPSITCYLVRWRRTLTGYLRQTLIDVSAGGIQMTPVSHPLHHPTPITLPSMHPAASRVLGPNWYENKRLTLLDLPVTGTYTGRDKLGHCPPPPATFYPNPYLHCKWFWKTIYQCQKTLVIHLVHWYIDVSL